VAALPLTIRDKVIGMMAVYSETRGVFNEEEIDLLKELAGDISLGITKIRQRIETARSEAKYAALVNNSNDGIIILQNALVKFSSNHMNKMTGFSPGEYLNKPFIDFVSPAYQELLIEYYKKRTAGEAVPNRYEADILTRDGKPLPVEINASLVEYEGKPADMAIIRDITERKMAEEALRKSEENHRNSMDQSPVGIIIADANYKITYANHAFLNMHGYSSIEEFKAVSPGKIEESANPQFLTALK
jgi:PAS domain S-box-containing protein